MSARKNDDCGCSNPGSSKLPKPASSRLPTRPSRLPTTSSCARTCPSKSSNATSRPSSYSSNARSGIASRGKITTITTKTITNTRSGKSSTTTTERYEPPDDSAGPPCGSRSYTRMSGIPYCAQRRNFGMFDPDAAGPTPGGSGQTVQCPAYGSAPTSSTSQSAAKAEAVLTELEQRVAEELLEKSQNSPDGIAQAQGSSQGVDEAPVMMTEDGPIQGTHQIKMEQTVDRSSEVEMIKKHMTILEASKCGCAGKEEYSIQQIQPTCGSTSRRYNPQTAKHEVVTVKSSVTVGPDYQEHINTTIYEEDPPEGGDDIDPAEVTQMIEEEIEDVEKLSNLQPPELRGSTSASFALKKRLQKMKLNPDSVKLLESSVVYPPLSPDEAQEEMQPELMAAIMHTEEQGLNMDSFPNNVYNYLFPDVKDDVVIKINQAAHGILTNVVVPGTTVPSQVCLHTVTPELESIAAEASGFGKVKPVENLFSQSVLKSGAGPKIHNTATKSVSKAVSATPVGSKAPLPNISAETPPWGPDDMQPMISLVGAPPSHSSKEADLVEVPSAVYHELENMLEYHLMPEPPQHISRVQLRGSQKPPWFPGYYIALPDNIKVVTSPCEVLPAAWQAVQPDIFSDDSFLIVG